MWVALGRMKIKVELHYDHVGAVREVVIERKEDIPDDDYLKLSKIEVYLYLACVAENLVQHFLDDLLFAVTFTSVVGLKHKIITKIMTPSPRHQLPE